MDETLYDVTGEDRDGARVPLAADWDSYEAASQRAEESSRDTATWKRVTVRDGDTGRLVRSYAGGQPETIGMVQIRR
jgi:hypothetical protein